MSTPGKMAAHMQPVEPDEPDDHRCVLGAADNRVKTRADKFKVWTTLILCLVEMLLFGGTIFAWNIIAFVLKKDNVYGCDESNPSLNSSWQEISASQEYFLTGTNSTTTTLLHPTATALSARASSGNLTSETPGGESVAYKLRDCSSQDEHLSLAFTVAIALMGLFAVPSGWFFDSWGLRISRFIAVFLLLAGFLMLAFADGSWSCLIYSGGPCISVANVIMMVTGFHICSLAGTRTSTMVALYTGACSTSGVVLLLIKLLRDAGFPRRYSLFIMTAFLSLVLFTSLVLLPKYKIEHEKIIETLDIQSQASKAVLEIGKSLPEIEKVLPEMENVLPEMEQTTPLNVDVATSPIQDVRPSTEKAVKQNGGFLDSLKSSFLTLHIFWFSFHHLRAQYYVGIFVPWATYMTDARVQYVSQACDVFGYSLVVCLVLAPLVGMLMDARRRYIKVNRIKGYQRAIAVLPPLLTASSLGVLLSCLVLLPHWSVVYITTILHQIYRTFLYATAYAYVEFVFPAHHFGKLLALLFLIGGLVNLLQYALFLWAEEASYMPGNALLVAVALSTFIHPVNIWVRHRLTMRRHRRVPLGQ